LHLVGQLHLDLQGMSGNLERIDRKIPDPKEKGARAEGSRGVRERGIETPRLSTNDRRDSSSEIPSLSKLKKTYHHLTAPHKVLLWPSIYIHLMNLGHQHVGDLQQVVLQEGTGWFLKQELARHPDPLPSTPPLPTLPQVPQVIRDQRSFSLLAYDVMAKYSDYYFNTFNVIYPLLNRQEFMEETLPAVFRAGFAENAPPSSLALSVFALGRLAQEGTWGEPINVGNGRPSGIRGGNKDIPPALELFNEARRRLGFIVSTCCIESIQVSLLHA
jgi:hypothetical protein